MGELAAVVCNEAIGAVKESPLNLYSLVLKSPAIPLFKECVGSLDASSVSFFMEILHPLRMHRQEF